MREKVIQFGKNKSLVGIISYPYPVRDEHNRPAVIILNSGLIHRVGPNRNSVKIARRLASVGFVVLRFDRSGVGDSRTRNDNLPFAISSRMETQEGMDYLTKIRGIQKYILMGICGGAFTAFETACVDPRVKGVAAIDLFGASSIGFQIDNYKKQLLKLRSWWKLIRGKSDLFGILGRCLRTMIQAERSSYQLDKDWQSSAKEKYIAGFHSLTQRGVNLCLFYSTEGAAYYNYHKLFKDDVQSLQSSGKIQVEFIKDADHLFTLLNYQEMLINMIAGWVQSIAANGREPSKHKDRMRIF